MSQEDVYLSVKLTNIQYYRNLEREREKWKKHPSKIYGLPRILNWIFKYLKPNSTVLDACSGIGIYASNMAKNGLIPICLDISADAILAGKKWDRNLRDFIVADAEYMPIRDQSLDSVIFIAGLHHLPRSDVGLSESFRLLKKGGILILCEPNSMNIGFFIRLLKDQKRLRTAIRLLLTSRDKNYYLGKTEALGHSYFKEINSEGFVRIGDKDQKISLNYILKLLKRREFKIIDMKTHRIAISAFSQFKKDIGIELYGKLLKIDALLKAIPILNKFGSLMFIAAKKV